MESSGMFSGDKWTWEENKEFEKLLLLHPESDPHRFEAMASVIKTKFAAQVEQHYIDLIHDVGLIESGQVPLLDYNYGDKVDEEEERLAAEPQKPAKGRGTKWTEEEHRFFLEGLKKYGKGDWRSISRHAVQTRSPSQVASHAQKYFLRQAELAARPRKRRSIHDIDLVGVSGENPKPGKRVNQQQMDDVQQLGLDHQLTHPQQGLVDSPQKQEQNIVNEFEELPINCYFEETDLDGFIW